MREEAVVAFRDVSLVLVYIVVKLALCFIVVLKIPPPGVGNRVGELIYVSLLIWPYSRGCSSVGF